MVVGAVSVTGLAGQEQNFVFGVGILGSQCERRHEADDQQRTDQAAINSIHRVLSSWTIQG